MKIAVLSDSHDHREHLAAAVEDAKNRGAEAILHCGDIVAPSTLHAAQPYGIPLHVIHGNNMGDTYNLARLANKPNSGITYYGQDAAIELAGRKIFVVHYPHYARAMAVTGDFDLVCNGHEHKARIDRVNASNGKEVVWLDPGTVGGISAPATYILGDLTEMAFEVLQVPFP
jgi:putative phosphoesterase